MTVTAQIIIIVMQIITVAAGIAFLIYARGKNIVYNKALVFLGIGSSLLLLWVMFDVPLDRIASDPIVPWMISFCGPVLALGPIGIAVKFEEDYFDERFFIWKRRHFYKDVTGYKIEKHKSIKGPDLDELVLYFGDKKTSLFIGTNFSEFFELISNEYRKNHNGEELPKKSEVKENIIETAPESVSESPVLRIAEENEDFKILVGAEVPGYRICLRRKKRNHELVINNCVYAEYIALGEEFEIRVRVDGHEISSGNNGDYYTIDFDGENIGKEKIIFKNFLK